VIEPIDLETGGTAHHEATSADCLGLPDALEDPRRARIEAAGFADVG
jgi:hypothetical protein